MALLVLPDVIALTRAYLLSLPAVTDLVGERVDTVSPSDTGSPWVRMTRIGGQALERHSWDVAIVQFDCFAPPRTAAGQDPATHGLPAADLVARTVRAAMVDLERVGFEHGGALLGAATENVGPVQSHDTSRTPPTPWVRTTFQLSSRRV